MFENEQNQAPNFSDIPALGDSQGLENFLNNEALASQGLPVQEQQQQPAQQASNVAGNQESAPETPQNQGDTITLTREQLNAILANRGQPAPQQQPQQQNVPQRQAYTAQEQTFITNALARGYSLEQINDFLSRQRNTQNVNPILEKRLAGIEQYLRTQEYQAAESAFINKLTDFGNKWGLSEQDLVTFGNEALKQGINIAVENVNLETVFRAIYPEQYSIRSRRMTPTTSSQIYGGTSIPESSRANTSKLEDAYVDNFLKGAMPNQYAAFKK